MHRSSPRDNNLLSINLVRLGGVFLFPHGAAGPRGTAAAVAAKNSPPDCFLNAATVLEEITIQSFQAVSAYLQELLFLWRTTGPRDIAAPSESFIIFLKNPVLLGVFIFCK